MTRVSFNDPFPGGLGHYDFQINHDEEDPWGVTMEVTKTASTGGVPVRQIGSASFDDLTIKGTVLQHSQLVKFFEYMAACMGVVGPRRTVVYSDPLGRTFEVQIMKVTPTLVRVAHNPRGETEEQKLVKWTYSLTMSIVRAITGWP